MLACAAISCGLVFSNVKYRACKKDNETGCAALEQHVISIVNKLHLLATIFRELHFLYHGG